MGVAFSWDVKRRKIQKTIDFSEWKRYYYAMNERE